MTREAYSHEVSSIGFWPGSGDVKAAASYSYTVSEPLGFKEVHVHPAFYQPQLWEYLLMYEDVRRSPSPSSSLLDSCQSTYEAGAILGNWDRANLEKTARASLS